MYGLLSLLLHQDPIKVNMFAIYLFIYLLAESHSLAQAGLKFTDLLASTSQVLILKACAPFLAVF